MTEPAARTTPARPSRSKAWLVAIRPATLPAAVGPVLVGLAVAISLGVIEVICPFYCMIDDLVKPIRH